MSTLESTTIHVESENLQKLRVIATGRRKSMSFIIRELIFDFIKKAEETGIDDRQV